MGVQVSGPVTRHVKLPSAYGAAPNGTRPLAAPGATHGRIPSPLRFAPQ